MEEAERKAKNAEKSRQWRAENPGYDARSPEAIERRKAQHNAYQKEWSKRHPALFRL